MISKIAAVTVRKAPAAAVAAQPKVVSKGVTILQTVKETPKPTQVSDAISAKFHEYISLALGSDAADLYTDSGKTTKHSNDRLQLAFGGKKAEMHATCKLLDIPFTESFDARELTREIRDYLLENVDALIENHEAVGSPSGSSSDGKVASGAADDDEAVEAVEADAKAKPRCITAKTTPVFKKQWSSTFGKASASKLLPVTTTGNITKDVMKAALGGKVADVRAALDKAKIPYEAKLTVEQLVAIARDHVMEKAGLL